MAPSSIFAVKTLRSLRCVCGIEVAGWAQGLRRSKAYMANALAIVVSWALGRILLSLGLFRHMYLHRSELSLIDRPGAGCDRLGALCPAQGCYLRSDRRRHSVLA